MAIVFHCQFCSKEIRAADSAGGKWGKCPKCHNKVYVPAPDSEIEDEELKLAPVDSEEMQRKKQLMAETYRLTQDILEERDVSSNNYETSQAAPGISDEQLKKYVLLYLRQMAAGELDEADRTSLTIAKYGTKAIDIIDKIALSEIPDPKLANISQNILSGFIRTLRSRIH